MQLSSSSRVNFTTSVVNFNYVQLLSKNRPARKRVQDIVTLLGLHTDAISHFSSDSAKVVIHSQSQKNWLKSNILVLCVVKKLNFMYEKTVWWLQLKLNMCGEYIYMEFELNLRTKVINISSFNKQSRRNLWVIIITSSGKHFQILNESKFKEVVKMLYFNNKMIVKLSFHFNFFQLLSVWQLTMIVTKEYLGTYLS